MLINVMYKYLGVLYNGWLLCPVVSPLVDFLSTFATSMVLLLIKRGSLGIVEKPWETGDSWFDRGH